MKKHWFLVVFLSLGLLLGACQQIDLPLPGVDPTPTPIPTVVGDASLTVEGRLVPREYVNLSFNLNGVIAEVLVEEGDQIKQGAIIARLDRYDTLAAAVAEAELGIITARQNLEALYDNAPVNSAAAEQEVAAARDALRDAERYRDNLLNGGRQTDIDQARANVILLRDQLTQVQEDFEPYEKKPEDNLTRARLQAQLAQVQQMYDDAVRLVNNLEGNANEIDLAVAEATVELAQARLELAQLELEEVKSGPDPDDLEAAQARLAAAEAGLGAAQATLEDAELVAPISGTVVKLDLKRGEGALPGIPVALLADFAQWKVETQDLNEMELPRVSVGQRVIINPDALSDTVLEGEVKQVSEYFVEKFGDITYIAEIVLLETDPRLRWGMTVSVQFEDGD